LIRLLLCGGSDLAQLKNGANQWCERLYSNYSQPCLSHPCVREATHPHEIERIGKHKTTYRY
jgi:hypothetical protein